MQSCRRGVGVVFKNTCSSYASTSRYTLDHLSPPPPPPLFEQLYPPTLSSSPTESKQLVHSPSKGRGRRSRRHQSLLKRRIESLNLSSPPSSPRSPLPPTITRTTRSDQEEVSPYLPQITREKNFLLSQFRSNLHSHSHSHSHSHLSRSSSSRLRNRRNTTSNRSIEQTWLNFVKLLRYPSEELPILPQSHFPTSTSTTAREGEESGRSDNNQIESSLFSLKELHELFRIFSKSRPKTRNGLHRLLIVTELISRHHPPPSSPSSHEGVIGSTSLQGGGRGLSNREWNQLFSFVGKSMRSVKPDPEIKSVLALYSQSQQSINSSSRSSSGSREELKMYNTLLDLAQRSRMNELFDQILEKILEKRIRGDGATFSIRMKRESDRGTGQDLLFKLFKQGLESTVGGKRFKKQSRKVLWNCLVWSLAKKGDFEKVEKIYKAMKNREEVTGLGGEEESSLSLSSFGRPPLPDFSCYSSLIQAYCHYGQLKKSLLTMYEMIHLGRYSPTPQHFHQLFRAFVRFGESPPHHRGSGRGGYEELDWISLRGIKYDNRDKSFNSSSSSSPLSTVLLSKSQSSSSRRSSSSSSKPQVVVVEGKDEKNEFNLSTLQTIFESFLSIQPPLPSSSSSSTKQVFQGERTSPKPQTIYFLLKAFSKLGSFENEPEILLGIYDLVEKKFTNKNNEIEEGNSGSKRKWKGWKMDKRIEKLVKDLRLRVEDREKRLKELM
ncbi:hypothetical protein JCM5350_008323 [Sporobolomyces pararoseus]